MIRKEPDHAAPTGLADRLGRGIYKHAAPSGAFPQHALCQRATVAMVNVALMGQFTMGGEKAIVSNYRNRTFLNCGALPDTCVAPPL